MTKTADQREKDLKDGPTWVVVTAWSQAISGVQKDLNAPIFLKSGNVGALADRYDKLQSEFNKNREKKSAAVDLFDTTNGQLDKIEKEVDGLAKEIGAIAKDENASVKTQTSDDPQAVITEWENTLKASQDQDKATKVVFDRWTKLNANYDKVMSDAIAKVKKDVAAAQAGLNSTNTQLNALEGEMRKVVGAYQNTATEMNRQDIASAVRGFLAIFAKA
jgi:chromosome segregation ATPase